MEVIPTLRLKLAEGRSGSSRHWAGVSWFLVFTSCTAVYCSKCLETPRLQRNGAFVCFCQFQDQIVQIHDLIRSHDFLACFACFTFRTFRAFSVQCGNLNVAGCLGRPKDRVKLPGRYTPGIAEQFCMIP